MDAYRRRQIEQTLAAELFETQNSLKNAHARLREIAGRVPSGIPGTDSKLQLMQAGHACIHAGRASREALQRWSDFIAYGTVPRELRGKDFDPPPRSGD